MIQTFKFGTRVLRPDPDKSYRRKTRQLQVAILVRTMHTSNNNTARMANIPLARSRDTRGIQRIDDIDQFDFVKLITSMFPHAGKAPWSRLIDPAAPSKKVRQTCPRILVGSGATWVARGAGEQDTCLFHSFSAVAWKTRQGAPIGCNYTNKSSCHYR